ncbi:MAG: BT_3928 family protein [Bacteroidales bacterium]
MRRAVTISRYIIAILFLFSGFTKLMDPVGTSLIIEEYLKAAGFYPMEALTLIGGALLSLAELSIGVALSVGLMARLFAFLSFISLLFFTILTLFLAIFNPITDCGCFGEVVKLTNWQTFFKNLIFLPLSLLLLLNIKTIAPSRSPRVEVRVLLSLISLFTLFLVLSYIYLPIVDTMDYKRGVSLRERAGLDGELNHSPFETTLIYSKDGVNYNFTIDSLPDSTYTFVESYSSIIESATEPQNFEFAISDYQGNYLTEHLLSSEGKEILITIPRSYNLTKRRVKRINTLYSYLEERGYSTLVLTGTKRDSWEIEERGEIVAPLYHTDQKTLLSMNRSNGGVVLLSDGTIVKKYSSIGMSYKKMEKILEEDWELMLAKGEIRANLTIQFIPLVIFLLLVAAGRVLTLIIMRQDENS